MKRLMDILIAWIGIAITAPIMVLSAMLIRFDSPGPAIFKQKRTGKNGRPFFIYKFRTMIESADTLGPAITARNDPRITQVGQLIRWLKIDELPQLFNVLKGDMSIIGPRPEIPQISALYTEEQQKILGVKPGIMGCSQISNRDEESMLTEKDDVEDFYIKTLLPRKLERDLAYVKNKDPFKDLKILFGGSAFLILSSIKFRYILESRRRFLFLLFDIIISLISFLMAFNLRFEGVVGSAEWHLMLRTLPFIMILRAPCFIYFGLYQTLWQYLGIQELLSIVKAVTVGSLLIPLVSVVLQIDPFPRSILVIDWFQIIMALGGARVFYKITADKLRKPRFDSRKNVLIIGAEDTGELLIREFIKQPELGYKPVGFLDNNSEKQGMRIHGIKVLGKISQLSQVVKIKKVDEVLIALSRISGEDMKELINDCRELGLICRIIPQASAVLSPQLLPLKLRQVDVSDLLGRELVQTDVAGIQKFFQGKRVLITGGGGSIGSELAKIIHQTHPRELILVDNCESNLYDIEMDLQAKSTETEVLCYLRNVSNLEEMEKIFQRHKPQIVYHAAAYKHVPLLEMHYREGILNNILGTKAMADLALKYGAESFVLISTDKAIRPRSMMGATKRISELYAQSLKGKKTRFLAVRFGNVFNSKGSVVPLFKKQIEEGLPVTITDPNVKRYFMDLSEAVFLILQATILGSTSEIFVLDMGRPIKIVDLAQELGQLMGVPKKRLPIRYVGLRPGEKLEEELELDSEQAIATAHKKIKIWKSVEQPEANISKEIDDLVRMVHHGASRNDVIEKIKQIVPEYNPWYLPD